MRRSSNETRNDNNISRREIKETENERGREREEEEVEKRNMHKQMMCAVMKMRSELAGYPASAAQRATRTNKSNEWVDKEESAKDMYELNGQVSHVKIFTPSLILDAHLNPIISQ